MFLFHPVYQEACADFQQLSVITEAGDTIQVCTHRCLRTHGVGFKRTLHGCQEIERPKDTPSNTYLDSQVLVAWKRVSRSDLYQVSGLVPVLWAAPEHERRKGEGLTCRGVSAPLGGPQPACLAFLLECGFLSNPVPLFLWRQDIWFCHHCSWHPRECVSPPGPEREETSTRHQN